MQYVVPLQRIAPDLTLAVQSLLDADYLRRKYASRSVFVATMRCYGTRALASALRQKPAVWWIEKELWPFVPAGIELCLLKKAPYVLDLDDAIFHNYDIHRSAAVRRIYGHKIDRLMAGAALVTAGNEYLANRARYAGARWIEVLPTVIDLERYPRRRQSSGKPDGALTIGWIGSPATSKYLGEIAQPLARLGCRHRVRLVVIGGSAIPISGVEVVALPWSEATEVDSIAGLDIGVMPLADDPWERGKCAYKLIQYMACGLPVVASPVGANNSVVTDGVNGFLARNADGWHDAFERLATDPDLRARLGSAGRALVESDYCVQVTAPRLARWLRAVIQGAG